MCFFMFLLICDELLGISKQICVAEIFCLIEANGGEATASCTAWVLILCDSKSRWKKKTDFSSKGSECFLGCVFRSLAPSERGVPFATSL